MIYKQMKCMGEILPVIRKLDDDQFIPFDASNVEYQKYQQWLSEGNQPLPADEVTL